MRRLITIVLLGWFSWASADQSSVIVPSLNNFAFDSYRLIAQSNGNISYSPYSLAAILTVLSEGAAGNTYTELRAVLHLPSSSNDILSDLADTNKQSFKVSSCKSPVSCYLRKVSNKLHNSSREAFLLANAIWLQKDLALNSTFLAKVNTSKITKMYTVDFRNNPKIARESLNKWVKRKTNGFISDLFPQGSITTQTQLVLANAIYFRGLWEKPFKKIETRFQRFNRLNGNSKKVQMMNQTEKFIYSTDNDLQMLVLPYQKANLAMAIILPKKLNGLTDVIASLNTIRFERLLKQSSFRRVSVALPKFKLATSFDKLASILQSMGLRDAFSSKADFSRMTTSKVAISTIIQKAVLETDEAGTTAAAGTGAIMFGAALPAKPLAFTADHPFLFLVFDRDTHVIYFMGQVTDPIS